MKHISPLPFIILLISFCFPPFISMSAETEKEGPLYLPEILEFENDDDLADLIASGVIIWRTRENMALALIPVESDVAKYRKSGSHAPRTAKRPFVPAMDIAKKYFEADKVISGQGLPSPYTGKGVVVGFCDIGFDSNHINFKDKNGDSRISLIVHYDEPMGVRKVMSSKSEINSWVTDDSSQSHATHVAGIMTGSFDNGFSGMAPDAEIVAVTSRLYDVGILAACEDIIEYARSVDKPAVINLSIGSYNGPHDGSTLFNRYLSLLGREAIVCIASGNEGNSNNTARITFTDDKPQWNVRIHSTDWRMFDMYGMTDIWCYDSRPVNFRFHIYDEVTGSSVYESPVLNSAAQFPFEINSDNDPQFASFMTGYVAIDGYIDPRNGRWVTELLYETHTDFGNPDADNKWARYNLSFEISGEPGQKADITADCQYSRLASWPGYSGPGSSLSVSDIATGDNVVCVGMYNNRAEYPTLENGFVSTGYEPGVVNIRSGYGTLVDGRILPDVVAPGAGIISSASTPHLQSNPDDIKNMNVSATVDGKTYYWDHNSGTSMSTPYVAGVIATWLQANPDLTIGDVKEILAATNDRESYDTSDPRNGLGWLQPYEGIKMVLRSSGIQNGVIDSQTETPSIVFSGTSADILNPGGNLVEISVFSLEGFMVKTPFRTTEPVCSLDMSSFGKGIYIIMVKSELGKPVYRKISLRAEG